MKKKVFFGKFGGFLKILFGFLKEIEMEFDKEMDEAAAKIQKHYRNKKKPQQATVSEKTKEPGILKK